MIDKLLTIVLAAVFNAPSASSPKMQLSVPLLWTGINKRLYLSPRPYVVIKRLNMNIPIVPAINFNDPIDGQGQ